MLNYVHIFGKIQLFNSYIKKLGTIACKRLFFVSVFATCLALMFIYFKITSCINRKFKYKIYSIKTLPLLPVTEKNN